MTTCIERHEFAELFSNGKIPELIDRYFAIGPLTLCFAVIGFSAFPNLVRKILDRYPGDDDDHAAVSARCKMCDEYKPFSVEDSVQLCMRPSLNLYRTWLAQAAVQRVLKGSLPKS